jgi:phosphate-selective porin OprO and OprP
MARHIWLVALCTVFPIAFAGATSQLQAAEPSTEASPPSAAQPVVQAPATDVKTSFIRSLLVDKKFPRTGFKWGAQLMGDFPLNDEPDDADITLRRAQLALWKTFSPNWSFKLTALYNSNQLQVNDNYLRYSGWKTAILQFGVFSPPFSLESINDVTGVTFMEKNLGVYALSERKMGGLGVLKRTATSILEGGLFFFTPKQDDTNSSGQTLVMRYVYSPVDFAGRAGIHLGGSFSYRINAMADQTDFKSRPEVYVADDYFVDAGTISGSSSVLRAGLEATRIAGRFSWQTELLSAHIQRDGYGDIGFKGAYAQVSWFLTDDSRNYRAGTGKYVAVEPRDPVFKGGRGAFELAARASYVDLTDKDITGGTESNISLGLNWYLNNQIRVMTNVIKVLDVDRPGSPYDGEDPLIIALRLQWVLE